MVAAALLGATGDPAPTIFHVHSQTHTDMKQYRNVERNNGDACHFVANGNNYIPNSVYRKANKKNTAPL